MLYNACSDKFIIFDNTLKPHLAGNPDLIESAAREFYNQLLEGGFIVENDYDDIKAVIDNGLNICNNNTNYNLIINPTTNCNFNCWYCYEKHSPEARMDLQTKERIELFIRKVIESGIEVFDLSFFGGEPLLYYDNTVRPIIDKVREMVSSYPECKLKVNYHFTTNGYLCGERVISHLDEGDEGKSFQITLDGNRDLHNKVRFSASGLGSYDRIIKNIKRIAEKQWRVNVRINYTKANAESVIHILDDFKDMPEKVRNYINFDFQKVWQENMSQSDDKIIEDTISDFRESDFCVTDSYSHVNAYRYPCYADMKNECVINYNGDVYKCTARDFTRENRLGELSKDGEIIWDNPEFIERRTCMKFNKEVCQKCRIFPICGGGCAQISLEKNSDNCPKNRSELEKDKIILNRLYNNIIRNYGKYES